MSVLTTIFLVNLV